MNYVLKSFLVLSLLYVHNSSRGTTTPAPLSASRPALQSDHIIRIPTAQSGCFSVNIKDPNVLEADLSFLSVIGVLYDHLEGRTIYLGVIPFNILKKSIVEKKNIFSFSAVPDSVEFFLYVLKKDSVTKKITQQKASDYLDVNFFDSNSGACQNADNRLKLTQEEIEKAQTMWSAKGGSLREKAKEKWNSLSPKQKKAAKAALIIGTVLAGVAVSALAYNAIQKKRAQGDESEKLLLAPSNSSEEFLPPPRHSALWRAEIEKARTALAAAGIDPSDVDTSYAEAYSEAKTEERKAIIIEGARFNSEKARKERDEKLEQGKTAEKVTAQQEAQKESEKLGLSGDNKDQFEAKYVKRVTSPKIHTREKETQDIVANALTNAYNIDSINATTIANLPGGPEQLAAVYQQSQKFTDLRPQQRLQYVSDSAHAIALNNQDLLEKTKEIYEGADFIVASKTRGVPAFFAVELAEKLDSPVYKDSETATTDLVEKYVIFGKIAEKAIEDNNISQEKLMHVAGGVKLLIKEIEQQKDITPATQDKFEKDINSILQKNVAFKNLQK